MADLISLSEYKAYTGVNSDTNDVLHTILIKSISDLIRTYCGRNFTDFYNTNKVEVFDGGDSQLILSEVPIVQVVSVERSFDYGQNYVVLTQYNDYVVKNVEGTIQALSTGLTTTDLPLLTNNGSDIYIRGSRMPVFIKALNGYRVTYKGGFVSCPTDLKLAVFDLVTYYSRSDMAIKSTRVAGSANSATVEYVTNTTFPAHIRRVLDMYRLTW